MSTWSHKGIEIEALPSGQFKAMFGDIAIIKGSLATIKKDIDRRLDAKAKEVALDLPVVIVRVPTWRSEAPHLVERATITGISSDKNKILGIDPPDGYRNGFALPFSEENELLLRGWLDHYMEEKRLKQIVDELAVRTGFGEMYSYSEVV